MKRILIVFILAFPLCLTLPANASTGQLDDQLLAAVKRDVGFRGVDVDSIKALLDKGADVNARDSSGNTPLILVACKGIDHGLHVPLGEPPTDITKLLIDRGADVNAKNNAGWTALMDAAGCGFENISRLLINSGADVNIEASDGRTALMLAAYRGAADIVRQLIAAHAAVNAKDKNGNTALSFAEKNALIERAPEYFDEIVQMLKAAGAEPEESDLKYMLFLTIRKGNLALMKDLLNKGANVNARKPKGGLPWEWGFRSLRS
ncbi:MAG: ankyrin repeat domain-containing protein, partial [Actinomycetota bacterium]|nr:ankyrin repeat domain-containing protein [Actinomycetota bacterium]